MFWQCQHNILKKKFDRNLNRKCVFFTFAFEWPGEVYDPTHSRSEESPNNTMDTIKLRSQVLLMSAGLLKICVVRRWSWVTLAKSDHQFFVEKNSGKEEESKLPFTNCFVSSHPAKYNNSVFEFPMFSFFNDIVDVRYINEIPAST